MDEADRDVMQMIDGQEFMSSAQMNNFIIDKEMVQNTLADLTKNYKVIEKEIEEKTKLERDHQQSRYQKVMELIDSLKLSLKTEVNNRKETED